HRSPVARRRRGHGRAGGGGAPGEPRAGRRARRRAGAEPRARPAVPARGGGDRRAPRRRAARQRRARARRRHPRRAIALLGGRDGLPARARSPGPHGAPARARGGEPGPPARQPRAAGRPPGPRDGALRSAAPPPRGGARAGRRARRQEGGGVSSACATAPGWRPLVTGGARDVVLGALRDLVAGLSRPDRIEPRADLAGGDPGLALLFCALAAGPAPAPIDCDERPMARAYLDRAIEEIARRRMPPALYSGRLGTAWVAQHLADDLCRPGGDPCGALVPILAGQVERGADGAHHDLTTGLAGAAV